MLEELILIQHLFGPSAGSMLSCSQYSFLEQTAFHWYKANQGISCKREIKIFSTPYKSAGIEMDSGERRTSQSGLHNEFHNAVVSGDTTLFQFYLRHYGHRKLLLDSYSEEGYTALQQCCLNGKTELAIALVEAGSSLEKVGKYGRTALHCAVLSNNLDLVVYLLNSFANVYANDESNNLPVDLAESREIRTTLLDFMRKRKVSLPTRSLSTGSGFHIDSNNNDDSFVRRRHSLETSLMYNSRISRCPLSFTNEADEDEMRERKNDSFREISSF